MKEGNMMLLSDFIKEMESWNHPNVAALLPLFKQNLKQHGDVTIDLDHMLGLMEVK